MTSCDRTVCDKTMDRALSALQVMTPPCSSWSAIEACLDSAAARARMVRRARLSAVALAASVLLAAMLINGWTSAHQSLGELQKTVDAAIQDARPQATFSGHQFEGRQPALEALLVSSRSRDQVKGKFIGDDTSETRGSVSGNNMESGGQVESGGQGDNPLNEF